MSADTLEIFKRQITLDLANPPVKRGDWRLERLSHDYRDMERVLETVTESIRSLFPDIFLLELQGRASLISGMAVTLRSGIVTVPMETSSESGRPEPVLEGLKETFASTRKRMGLSPSEPLDAVLVEDIVATGDSAHNLASALWQWDKIRIIHVASLIEDLRYNGRERVNSTIGINDNFRLNGLSYSTAVRFDPSVGFIKGITTPGIRADKTEELKTNIDSAGGRDGHDHEAHRYHHLPDFSKISSRSRITHSFRQGPGFS